MTTRVTRSPIGGFGSKCRACIEFRLHEYIPPFTTNRKVYVEPFAFSAVVFLNTKSRRAILNDIDSRIYNFWKVLKDKYSEIEKELKYVFPGKAWYDEYQERTDDVGKAVFFYICNCIARSGIPTENFKFKYMIKEFDKDLGYIKKRFDSMQSLVIWNFHFRDVYERLAEKGGNEFSFVWYVDPPYILEKDVYPHSMTIAEHEELAKLHASMKDNPSTHVIISYNDCEKVRRMYDGWHFKEISFATGSVARSKNEYHELLISNREIKRYDRKKAVSSL